MLFKQVWLLLWCGASCLFSCLKTSVNVSHLVSQCLVITTCEWWHWSLCIKADIGDWTKVQTVLWAVRWQQPCPPGSVPPSSIWSVADHDLWPRCRVGAGVEAEDHIPPQKSMHINKAAAFSVICVPALMNYCDLLFWDPQHTWLTHPKTTKWCRDSIAV